MPTEKYEKIIRMSRREEREKILGILEFYRDEMGDSTYENYAKKKLNTIIETIERE